MAITTKSAVKAQRTTHKSHLILYVYHILTNSNQSAHLRVRGNTLVEFEANRANGFRANRETDRKTDRRKDGKTERRKDGKTERRKDGKTERRKDRQRFA